MPADRESESAFAPSGFPSRNHGGKVICYADKFFSKTHLDREKTIQQAEKSLAKFGEEGVLRFKEWEKMFE